MPLIRTRVGTAAPAPPAGDDLAGLASASPSERWAAAREINDPASIPALADALGREEERQVREALFTALARIATHESALALLPYLRADDANVRTGALDALRAMPQTTKAQMPNLLADKDPDVRLLACELARNMGDAEGVRLLSELLEIEPVANVCAAAVDVMADIANAEAIPVLTRCGSRFPNDPFLAFAIRVAQDRLRSETAQPRE